MSPPTARYGALLVAAGALSACAGGGRAAPPTEAPVLVDTPSKPTGPLLAKGEQVADLTDCRRGLAGGQVENLTCGPVRISELRVPSNDGVDVRLDGVMASLESRYGVELAVERGLVELDGARVAMRVFTGGRQDGQSPVSGLVAAFENQEGLFWAVACFREERSVDLSFCRRAVAAVARAGGTAHVGARDLDPLELSGRALEVPGGCELKGPGHIRCDDASLSWSEVDGSHAAAELEQTRSRLRRAASAEGLTTSERTYPCKLDGVGSDCVEVRATDAGRSDGLVYVMASAAVRGVTVVAVCTSETGADSGSDAGRPTPPLAPVCAQIFEVASAAAEPEGVEK